ncbi:MAG TPA: carboxymuconolactone decarboxylase family protein, partial [Telmatospirillum sp.]|nr:carboxymuconolactone decarboxylase family protein [Telmatospirillum sp.]
IAGISRIWTNSLRILSVMVAVCGAISSFDRSILSKLTAEYSFDYWNFDDFVFGFFAEYLTIMGMYACFAYYALKLFQKLAQPRAPAIDAFLKDHLFGDIFGRDNLDFQSREIATISALSNMQGVNAQLQSHLNVGLNVGLTEAQLRGLILVLEANVGKSESDNANDVLSRVLSSRGE